MCGIRSWSGNGGRWERMENWFILCGSGDGGNGERDFGAGWLRVEGKEDIGSVGAEMFVHGEV